MRNGIFAFVGALGIMASGCGGSGPSTTGTVPDQLEAIAVDAGSSGSGVVDVSGPLTVTGSGRDYTLSVEVEGVAVPVKVHSPAASPIDKLAGATVTVKTTEGGFGGPSLLVEDDGGLSYAALFGDSAAIGEAEASLGKGFVRWGDEVGSETDGTFVWSYRKAVFTTDDGEVTADPGDVKVLKIKGATWRAVVVASYEVSANPDATDLPGCSPEDMLGVEMLRLAEAPAPETRIARLSGAEVAFAGCTAPGGRE